MKKLLFLFAMMLSIASSAIHAESTASCMVGNSNTEYVQVTVYPKRVNSSTAGATIKIVNASNKPLISLNITITGETSTMGKEEFNKESWTTRTLFSSNLIFDSFIAPNSTSTIDCPTTLNSYGGQIRNLEVTIGNPSCK